MYMSPVNQFSCPVSGPPVLCWGSSCCAQNFQLACCSNRHWRRSTPNTALPALLTYRPSRSSGAIPYDSGQNHVTGQLQPKIRSTSTLMPSYTIKVVGKKKPLISTVSILDSGFAPFFFSLFFFFPLLCFVAQCDLY